MRNLFKIGALAFIITLFLTGCSLAAHKSKASGAILDSIKRDSVILDSFRKDSIVKADSIKKDTTNKR